MKKILIIIPALNEADNILKTVKDIHENFTVPGVEILVVDDCSTDKTTTVLQQNNIPYVSLTHHLGIGAAVQTGYRYALEKDVAIAVQFDGDGQHDASYLGALIQPILDGTADYTVGSRFVQDSTPAGSTGFQSSSARRAGIRFLSFLVHALSGVKVKDVTSGMRAVNRDLIRLFASHYAQDYPEPEALVLAGRSGARIREVPVKMKERSSGKSSITPLKSVYYMIKVSLALVLTGCEKQKSSSSAEHGD